MTDPVLDEFEFEVIGGAPLPAPVAPVGAATKDSAAFVGEDGLAVAGGPDERPSSDNGNGTAPRHQQQQGFAIKLVDRSQGRVDVIVGGDEFIDDGRGAHVFPADGTTGDAEAQRADDIQQQLLFNDQHARELQEQGEQLAQPVAGRWRRLFQQGRATVLEQVYNLNLGGAHHPRSATSGTSASGALLRSLAGRTERERGGSSTEGAGAAEEDSAGDVGRELHPIYLLGRFYIESAFNTSFECKDTPAGVEGQPPVGLSPALNFAQQDLPPFVADFAADFHSTMWCTYRRDFAPLVPVAPHLTSDTGWGCLLRSMQMLLGHTLLRHLLTRDWRLNDGDLLSPHSTYRQVRRWFCDEDDPRCPYSIHNMIHANSQIERQLLQEETVRTTRARRKILQARERPRGDHGDRGALMGASSGSDRMSADSDSADRVNIPGEYFSPTRVCQIVKRLVRQHSPNDLTAYVATQAHVVRSRVEALATQTTAGQERSPPRSPAGSVSGDRPEVPVEEGGAGGANSDDHSERPWRPVLILVPVRLGADRVSDVYLDQLRTIFRMPECCGVVGGRPKESLYFVGYQQDDLFYLDPHSVRRAATIENEVHLKASGGIDSRSMARFVEDYHTPYPMAMPLSDIDPSLAFGFLCDTRSSFEHLCDQMSRLDTVYPLFHVVDRPDDTGMVSSSSEDVEFDEEEQVLGGDGDSSETGSDEEENNSRRSGLSASVVII